VRGESARVSARLVVARIDVASGRAAANGGRKAGVAVGQTWAALFREYEHVSVTWWEVKSRGRDHGRVEEKVSEQISRAERIERGEFESLV
tara:strand:- start:2326 stop:2598 length:273 start_codon:yes stop_codon:yes gene_type:complete